MLPKFVLLFLIFPSSKKNQILLIMANSVNSATSAF